MANYKYTQADIDRASKAGRIAMFVVLFIIFCATVPEIFLDKTMLFKDRVFGLIIQMSVLVVCYFAGEKFRKFYIKNKKDKLQS